MENNSNHCIKRITMICLIVLCLCMLCGSVFAAIDYGMDGGGTAPHEHAYTTRVGTFYNSTQCYEKWKCFCGATTSKNYKDHVYSSGKCIYCSRSEEKKCTSRDGLLAEHASYWDESWIQIDSMTHHVIVKCTKCNVSKRTPANHRYTNGKCVCGATEPHTCNYTIFKSNGKDGTEHWDVYACSCGKTTKKNIKDHEFVNAYTNTGTTGHNKQTKCAICEYILGTVGEPHIYKNGLCACGATKVHVCDYKSTGNGGYNNSEHWEILKCSCGKTTKTNIKDHNFTNLYTSTGTTGHNKQTKCAICGYILGTVGENHTFVNGNCKDCGSPQPHTCNYTIFKSRDKDSTEHWNVYACSCGKTTKKNIKDHEFVNEYTNTGTTGHNKQIKCAICGYISGTVGEPHTYEKGACVCGNPKTIAEGACKYVLISSKPATCTAGGEDKYKCNHCKKEKIVSTEPLGHNFNLNVKCTVKVYCKRCRQQYTGKEYGHQIAYKQVDAINHISYCKWCNGFQVLGKHTSENDCNYCEFKKEVVKRCEKNAVVIGHEYKLERKLELCDGKTHTEVVYCPVCKYTWKNNSTHVYTGERCECGEIYRCGKDALKTGHKATQISIDIYDSKEHIVGEKCTICGTQWNRMEEHEYKNGVCGCRAKENEKIKCIDGDLLISHSTKYQTTYKKIDALKHTQIITCTICKVSESAEREHWFSKGECIDCGEPEPKEKNKCTADYTVPGHVIKTEVTSWNYIMDNGKLNMNKHTVSQYDYCEKCNLKFNETEKVMDHVVKGTEIKEKGKDKHTITLRCSKGCKNAITVEVPHELNDEGVCKLCGYPANGEDGKPPVQCKHDGGKKTQFVYKDKEEHTKQTICEKCEHVLKEDNQKHDSKEVECINISWKKHNTIMYCKECDKKYHINEEHTFKNGVCDECKAPEDMEEVQSNQNQSNQDQSFQDVSKEIKLEKMRFEGNVSSNLKEYPILQMKEGNVVELSKYLKLTPKNAKVNLKYTIVSGQDGIVSLEIYSGRLEAKKVADKESNEVIIRAEDTVSGLSDEILIRVLENTKVDENDSGKKSQNFTDVADNAWYKEDVDKAVADGLFNGTSETTFSPNNPITRGMFVTVLARLDKADIENFANVFEDVKDNAYYQESISWAVANGIVNGVGNGNFAPDAQITREAMAVILYNYIKVAHPGLLREAVDISGFADQDDISLWAEEAVIALNSIGLINGKSNGKYMPKDIVTRAEGAVMLQRLADKVKSDMAVKVEISKQDMEKITILQKHDIIDKGINDLHTVMTGAEAVDSVLRLVNLQGFKGDYKTAEKRGIFNGLTKNINLNSKITNAEYITMIINALGYGDVVAAEGNWPVNYTMKARELNLFEGVEGALADNLLTKQTAINVLYNALNTELWERVESSNGITFKQTETVLERYFK